MALIPTLLAFPLIFLLFRPEIARTAGGREYIRKELKALATTTAAEWKTVAAFFLALGLWALDRTILGDALYNSLPPLLQAIVGLHPFIKGVMAASILNAYGHLDNLSGPHNVIIIILHSPRRNELESGARLIQHISRRPPGRPGMSPVLP